MDSFQFVFHGLAGDLIEVVNPPAQIKREGLLSIVFKLGDNIQNDASSGEKMTVAFLQVVYIMFSFVFPLLVVLSSYVLLFSPMNLREAKFFLYYYEIICAWGSSDVFILALIAAVVEINQFSHFLETDLCTPIKKVLHVSECFQVDTTLLNGSFCLVFSAISFWILTTFTHFIAEREIFEREYIYKSVVG